jgi:hydroxymethylglutaryl-CoA lyase
MRVELIQILQRARFPYIEAASFVSPKVFPQFADSAELMSKLKPYDGQLAALVPNVKYYEQFRATPNLTTVAVFLSASDEYSRKNKRISLADDLTDAKRIAAAAKHNGHRIRAHLSGAFRDLTAENRETDPKQVALICKELIDAGCETVALADTDGRATPKDIRHVISHLRESELDIAKIGVHLHDRDGRAIENLSEAFALGVRTFDGSVGGVGGNRAGTDYLGNIATERLVEFCTKTGNPHGVDASALREATTLVSKMVELSNS